MKKLQTFVRHMENVTIGPRSWVFLQDAEILLWRIYFVEKIMKGGGGCGRRL